MSGVFYVIIWIVQFLSMLQAQIEVYDIDLGDLYKMQKGIGWPDRLNVFVGHEALLKLETSLENIESCVVTTPEGVKFDVRQPPTNRYESWGDDCGVRVKNVVQSDTGRWRLTAFKGNDSVTGWTEVHVEDIIDNYSADPIVLHDGTTQAKVELSTLGNAYCLVSQPFSDSSLVPGHCSVTLDRTTRAVQGNWHVLMGLPGRVTELSIDRSVTVQSERLNTGFLIDSNPNKLHLFCNLEHTDKNITFCRFQKTTERAGYNIIDGLSDGAHSYYGDGFAKKHCGMTIESPTASDYAIWRCTVGVQEWVGNVIQQRTPLQALVRVVDLTSRSQISQNTHKDMNEERIIFVQKDMGFTISCQAEASLSYCWFQHPNGSQFTPVEKVNDDQEFWYSGESLQTGDCGITFNHASDDESGLWTCHMGPKDHVGIEYTDKVEVRVTGPLAARNEKVAATLGGSATLYCHTSNGNRPLDYCRFLTPQFVGISVDSTVTRENAILGRFSFTPGRDLDHGDCSLEIDPVLEEDVGEWTCAALVDEQLLESRDTIQFFVELSPESTFRAGVIGMAVGASALVIILMGVLVYRYRSKLNQISVPWRRTNNTERTNSTSLEMQMRYATDRISLGSDSSATVSNGEIERA